MAYPWGRCGVVRERGARLAFEAALLRQFISLYEGVDLPPESRIARYLEAARGAVVSYEQIEREPEARIG